MTWLQAGLLGLIEGLTEFIPVSSTGHLILGKRLLGLEGPGTNAFLIVVQLGALCAAIWYYRNVLLELFRGFFHRDPNAQRLMLHLMVASIPVLALGYLFGRSIKTHLFSATFVSVTLLVGAMVMILAEKLRRPESQTTTLHHLSLRQAFTIGALQALSLLPGTSRSMSCIVAGQLSGLSRVTAADFAFLLAIPTLGTATVYELFRSRQEIFSEVGIPELLIGLLVSFIVGLLVISFFLKYLRKHGLIPFALYRIALGLVILLVERF